MFRATTLVLLIVSTRQADDVLHHVIAPEPVEAPALEPRLLPVLVDHELGEHVGKIVDVRAADLQIMVKGSLIEVTWLVARLDPVGDYVDLDSPASFEVYIDAARIEIGNDSLAAAFRTMDGPIRKMKVDREGQSFVIDGSVTKIGVPFVVKADPRASTDGELVLDMEKVQVLGIGVQRLVKVFEDAIGDDPSLLVVRDGELFVDPFPFRGPPLVHAQFERVDVVGDRIIAEIGEKPSDMPEMQGVTLTGGVLRTGVSMLYNPTLMLRATDGGPLVVDPERFNAQLQAGFTKQGDGGRLTLHMVAPDALPSDLRPE